MYVTLDFSIREFILVKSEVFIQILCGITCHPTYFINTLTLCPEISRILDTNLGMSYVWLPTQCLPHLSSRLVVFISQDLGLNTTLGRRIEYCEQTNIYKLEQLFVLYVPILIPQITGLVRHNPGQSCKQP